MLNYSFSTVLMAVLTSTLLILVTTLCLRWLRMLRAAGSRLIIALLLLAMFRLFFPFEAPFSHNVHLSRIPSEIISTIVHPFFYLGKIEISGWFCLQCVWVGGAVVSLRKLYRTHSVIRRHVLRYGRDVSTKEPYRSAFHAVCGKREAGIPILLIPGLDAPRQDRILHPRILLPGEMTFSENQLRYIFRHELVHVRHHDVLIKLLVNLLAAVYWWNPLMRILRNELDVILEIHVDARVLAGGNWSTRSDYVDTLMEVAAQAEALLTAQKASNGQIFSSPMAFGSLGDLEGRLAMMYEKKKSSPPLILLLLAMTLSLYALSYVFILEAYSQPSATDWSQSAQKMDPHAADQEMYAVAADDGYDIYWNGVLTEHADSLEYYSGIPVIER